MAYSNFRYAAGADNMIDFNEFLEITRQKYPHLDQQTLYEIAHEKFTLMDRNGDGKINYNEYANANIKENTPYGNPPPYYPPPPPHSNPYPPSHQPPQNFHQHYYPPPPPQPPQQPTIMPIIYGKQTAKQMVLNHVFKKIFK
ncbi:unnamed protein product [Brachionus calyciflorus]|uniref:EF-hand domain-containing protein n=1 Tax=Brachionus calyciflorus TaxID=104777 RepID=A0A813WTR3_9BILA|nr:unnamed protein product [Brachionus calyciflorus]